MTSPVSGRATAITTTATRGSNSATRAIDLAAGPRGRGGRRDTSGEKYCVGAARLARAPSRPACRRAPDRRGRLPDPAQLLDRLSARGPAPDVDGRVDRGR